MRLKTLLILPFLAASLQAASVDDLTFTLNGAGTEYSVTDCLTSASGSLDIPSTYNGLPVTSIGDYAFSYCSSLSSITIGDSVTTIGRNAFRSCSNLSSITIGDSVNSIGDYAFNGCSSPSSIIIPNSVTSIGDFAFQSCSNLSSITIGDSVNSIGDYAFNGCSSLRSVTFEGNVPTFGVNVFDNTYGVSIYYDSSTDGWSSTIAGRPASQFNTLTFILNGNGTEYSVSDCLTSASDSLDIPSTYNGLPVTSIGDYAFQSCSSLSSIIIPDSVTSIGDFAFTSCTSLSSITIGDSVTSIGDNAFFNCNSLTDVIIPNSVTSIGDFAFTSCTSLSSITIGDSVTSIGDNAFFNCNSLTDVIIPNSVTSIGSYAFTSCTSLTSITIGDNVTSIEDWAFQSCSSLTSITIGDSVTSIGDYAFKSCFSLSSIIIPDSVTSIGDYAFQSCFSLSSIIIPGSVTSIGDYAFQSCSSLENVKLNENLVTIKSYAFYGCPQLETISIPSTVRDLGQNAFNHCSELREITFEGPPPAFSITNLQGYNITPTMYYKVSPQSWMVYQSSYGLPLVYLGPPTIQVQPQDAIASIGDSIMLSVEATDVRETALSYQWMCNGIEIAGKTAANLSIVSLAQSDVGNYQVKVTNAEGTTVTEGASVTIADGGISNGLYTQQQYDAALTSGFNLGVQSVGGSSDSGGSSGTPAATSAILDVYYSTDLSSWNLMESIEVENPPAGQMFMKTELTPPSE